MVAVEKHKWMLDVNSHNEGLALKVNSVGTIDCLSLHFGVHMLTRDAPSTQHIHTHTYMPSNAETIA